MSLALAVTLAVLTGAAFVASFVWAVTESRKR